MQAYIVEASELDPKVIFDPGKELFEMAGASRPEDVRELYYPMVEWFREFRQKCSEGAFPAYSKANPLVFNVKMDYFNSSSTKFLFDIFEELNTIGRESFPVKVGWYYDVDDDDMREAGEEIKEIVDLDFEFIGYSD